MRYFSGALVAAVVPMATLRNGDRDDRRYLCTSGRDALAASVVAAVVPTAIRPVAIGRSLLPSAGERVVGAARTAIPSCLPPAPLFCSAPVTMVRPPAEITKRHYETLASWRHALRQFLRFSHEAAHAAGIPPQQHQALLVMKGFPDRDYATVGEIAEALDLKHHSAVGLVDRLAKRQLVQRSVSPMDRRRIEVRLTARGESLIQRLSAVHLRELRQLRPELRRLLDAVEHE